MPPSRETPPFESIGIVGLGLIGGSIALATRQKWPGVHLTGLDDRAILDEALARGAIDAGADGLPALATVDLIVLAAPVRQNLERLRQVAQHVQRPILVTDVGGTKRAIVEAAAGLSPAFTFVGGHPLAGAAHAGLAFARADLFANRPWIFTPVAQRSQEAIDRLRRFASGVGAVPILMSPAEHDRLLAYLSHLPQLTASALMAAVGATVKEEGLALAGQGLKDTTRLASSPPSVWRDICATNADALSEALDLLIERLSALRADLRKGDTIEAIFNDAARWREELTKDRQ
jgi:prephenate dehydrogenase